MHWVKACNYIVGTDDYGELRAREYVVGDLVVFTGHVHSPDYTYVEHYDYKTLKVGIVLDIVNDEYYNDALYRVYWLKSARTTTTISSHLKLAYTRK